MAWLYVIAGGLLEIPWVMGLKYAYNLFTYSLVAVAIVASFFLIMKAYNYLPVGVVYAVFTGIGTVGVVIAEAVISGGSVSIEKVLFIFMIMVGVMGLKFTTRSH